MTDEIVKHPACNFRPRSFAQAEFGCQLTHCGFCNGHVDESDDRPCRQEAIFRNHSAWKERCLRELFEKFMKQVPSATAWDIFMFGVEGAGMEFHEYNLGDCGMSECPECHHEMED